MASVDEMMNENGCGAYSGNTLFVCNETDPLVSYEQPGCTAETLLKDIIANGDWRKTLGIDPDSGIHLKRARSRDNGLVPPEDLRLVDSKPREAALGKLGFFSDGFDTLLVNSNGDNG